MSHHKKAPEPRKYPPVYEKILPFLFGAIAVAILLLMVVSLAVIMGWFPNSR